MATEAHNAQHDLVQVRDRRDLPFFQVHVRALQRIRAHVNGPRRARTCGLFVVLCQMANEQRSWGEHARLKASYHDLQARAGIGASTVKQLLDALQDADVVGVERVAASSGATETIRYLLIRDGGWVPVSVAAAVAVARGSAARSGLRDLGTYAAYLELCNEQRREYGGTRAETTRAEIAERVGLSVDRLDAANQVLEKAGVLVVERRQREGANRNPPSVYTLVEPTEPRAAFWESPGRNMEVPGPQDRSPRVARRECRSRDAAPPAPKTRPANARAGGVEENGEEAITPQAPLEDGACAEGETDFSQAKELCQLLCEVWAPDLGDDPRRQFAARRRDWLEAAGRLLRRFERERLNQALAYAPTDEVLGSRAIDMPGLERVAGQLIARARAHQRRSAHTIRESTATDNGLPWPGAQARLTRAAGKHGRGGKAAAIAELVADDPRFEPFIAAFGWTELCERDLKYAGPEARQLWATLANQSTTRKETA